ncbi:MAG: hypothetical protein ACXVA9_14450 [Bdellovibrionales bacterium]
MTLPTKILLALVIVMAGSAFAYADVTAKDQDAVNFTASKAPTEVESVDQSQLTIREEIADDKLEANACAVDCHTVFGAPAKTALARFDLSKIK